MCWIVKTLSNYYILAYTVFFKISERNIDFRTGWGRNELPLIIPGAWYPFCIIILWEFRYKRYFEAISKIGKWVEVKDDAKP